jgi:hypothetical protein
MIPAKGSYVYTLLLALDRFAAAILFNRADITISSLCWVARNMLTTPPDPIAAAASAILKFAPWQVWFLTHTATALEFLQAGHCAEARQTDIETADTTEALLRGHT